jgi:hypothetical protein
MSIGLNTALDLYAKVLRDRAVVQDRVTPDALFNFVVTGHSLCEWVRKDPTLPQAARAAVDQFEATDEWIRACRDLANGNKHFAIDRYQPVVEHADAASGYGVGRFGVGPFGEGEWRIMISWDNVTHDALELVANVTKAWEEFFTRCGVVANGPAA